MAFVLFIFFVAAAISSVAAYFSLVGLGSIFAATFWGVVIMGGALEVGKIVATKWVHGNWRNPAAPWYFRTLVCFFIACLMAITSLGIYGYLSRGHLEQQAPLAGLSIQVAQLETQVQQRQAENARLEQRLSQIGRITDKVLDGNGRAGLRASQQQRQESSGIQKSIDANNQAINDLTTRLVPLKMKTGDVQGELGVAKFIAEAFGWAPEKAVRIIISLIMAAFDPLALSMFIMGSISLKEIQEKRLRAKAEAQSARDAPYSAEIADQRAALDAELEIFDNRLNELQRARADHDDNLVSLVEREALLEDITASLDRTEVRLTEERQLLKDWEDGLVAQQNAINNWRPPEDTRDPKERIIGMLEENPDIINDIVAVVDAIRPPQKPGL